MKKEKNLSSLAFLLILLVCTMLACTAQPIDELKQAFQNPPETSKPGV